MDGGECAVIFDRVRGVLPKVVGEGTHMLVPILQKPVIFETRMQAHEVSSHTGSRGMRVLLSSTSRALTA